MSENGGIGRRARLRALWPFRLWGFDSPFSHPFLNPPVFLVFILSSGSAFWGCSSPPEEAVQAAFEATENQDFQVFCSQFTRESCDVLQALQTVEDSQSRFKFPAKGGSLTIESSDIIALGSVRRTGNNTLEAVDLAWVTVNSGSDRWKIPLVKERGRWKIDLFLGVDRNNETRRLF
jgi:hypothetical protein